MHKIGILGAAGIAPRSIIQPANRSKDAVIHAVASRRPGAAAAYAEKHGIAKAHESYEAMLSDPEIDIVYNALPPAGHKEWSIAALKAGKHVLCEKPIAMDAEEAEEMVAEADRAGRILMEAFHDRYHPAFLHLLDLKTSGRLGKLKSVRAEFYVDIPFDPKSIRHDPAQGGGAMMDLGCYPVHWVRSIMQAEPEILSAKGTINPLGVDQSMHVEMRFPDGTPATVIADIASPPFRGLLRLEGERGIVELDNPCLPHKGHSIREWLEDEPYREHTLGAGTTYDYQLAAMIEAVETGRLPITGGADAIGNMLAVDRIYQSSGLREGR
ncbi:Gfo/Idh/MocA family oxidoreductase [Rhizobium sp. XQZ8]|uniref:Gfo/Idh/MocA family protein n=1 Tax=Rhizobium populisoli TaxID=2859785 RepID=UPI001C68405E|nr:Gfo/Idh/MocA family oxidoreductase [Rhizobium populisoli]MBW6425067.1 Gfo/Idh/MocA family oxidoreductase [Rhizobium populisoli]